MASYTAECLLTRDVFEDNTVEAKTSGQCLSRSRLIL